MSTSRDITEQMRIESELQMRARQQATVAELGQMALLGTDVATLMNVAAHRLAEILEVEYAKVLRHLPDGDTFLLLSGVGWREGLVGRAVIAGGVGSQAGYTLLCQEPVIVKDLRAETRFNGTPLLRDHGVVSGMSAIIGSRGVPFGVLGVHTTQRRAFSEDDVYCLQAVANVLAAAIDRRQAEDALRESEGRFRRLAENVPDAIFRQEIVPITRLSYVSTGVTRMLGYTPEDFYANPDLIYGVVDAESHRLVRSALEGRVSTEPETICLRHRDGHRVWAGVRSAPVCDDDGRLVAFEGIARDITRRVEAEKALDAAFDELRRRNAEAQALLESSRSILRQPRFRDSAWPIYESCKQLIGAMAGYIGVMSEQGLLVDIQFMELGGQLCDAGLPLPLPIHGLAQEAYRTRMTRFCNDLPGSQYAPLVPKGHIPLDNALYAPMIVEGDVVGLLGLANKPEGFSEEDARLASAFADLAALALHNSRTREALEHSQEHFSSVVETAGEAIICTDCSGCIISWNRQAENIFGYSAEEAIGRPVTFLVAEVSRHEVLDRIVEVSLSERVGILATGVEHLASTKANCQVPVEVSIAAWKTGTGLHFTFICRDITSRKLMEEQLLRAHRLEAAGRIAGQVAHDFNNLLGPLALYPDLVKLQLPEGHAAAEYCDIMLESVRHMAEINSDMLALARRAHVKREAVDLNRLIENTVAQMATSQDSLVVELELAPDLLPVNGAPGQLLRVVTNLLINARDAMEDIGRIKVKTEKLFVDALFGYHLRLQSGEYVRFSVSDDGPGIPQEIRDRLFDPFFTTKTSTEIRGSGLGLSIVQAIVEDHGGQLELRSEVGEGTTFSIYLPASREAIGERAAVQPERGEERLLVVDDDPVQRQLLGTALSKLGYTVDAVASGKAAVAFLVEHEVDLVILDMVMPGEIDGAETYRRARELYPGLRAIILSGFTESERVQEAQRLGAGGYLRKPVNLGELARAVREELSRR